MFVSLVAAFRALFVVVIVSVALIKYLCATFSTAWIDRMLHVKGNSFCFVLVAMDIIMLIKYILSPIFDRAFFCCW